MNNQKASDGFKLSSSSTREHLTLSKGMVVRIWFYEIYTYIWVYLLVYCFYQNPLIPNQMPEFSVARSIIRKIAFMMLGPRHRLNGNQKKRIKEENQFNSDCETAKHHMNTGHNENKTVYPSGNQLLYCELWSK